MKIEINNAKESIVKMAKPHGNSARLLVPKRWVGKQVQCVLLEDEDEK